MLKMLWLKINPVYWILVFFLVVLLIIITVNYHKFDFQNANLFTPVWTYLALLVIYTLINVRTFVRLFQDRQRSDILSRYIKLTLLFMPYLVIALIYENLILFTEFYQSSQNTIDQQLMVIDRQLFGCQPTLWLQQWIHPWLVEIHMIGYALFMIYPYFYLIFLIQRKEIEIFEEVLFAQVFMLIISLISFVLLPAMGPRFALNPETTMLVGKIDFYSIELKGISSQLIEWLTGRPSFYQVQVDLWNYLERVKTDCMPSMHAGLCLLCLVYALKQRRLFKHRALAQWVWIVGNTLLISSTVYLRYHWVIDVLAGMLLVVIVYWFSRFVFAVWLKQRRKAGFAEFKVIHQIESTS
jgi:membrane-associated phospholipid phosphatase